MTGLHRIPEFYRFCHYFLNNICDRVKNDGIRNSGSQGYNQKELKKLNDSTTMHHNYYVMALYFGSLEFDLWLFSANEHYSLFGLP